MSFLSSGAGGAEATSETTVKVALSSGRGLIKALDGKGGPVILESGQMSVGLSEPQPVGINERMSIQEFAAFVKFTSKEDSALKRTWQWALRSSMKLAGRDYYGVLAINSDPAGVRVYIDDYPVGDAPLAIREEPGRHLVKVSLKGHHVWQNTAEVKSGRTTYLMADLAPSAPRAEIRPTTVQGRLVTRIAVVEGKVALKKPTASGGLEELIVVGANQSTRLVEEAVLEIRGDGEMVSIAKARVVSEQPILPLRIEVLDETDRQIIQAAATSIQKVVEEAKDLQAGIAKKYGKLFIASIPVGGQVYLNGEPRGQAPLVVRMEEGVHQVRVEVPGLSDWSREVKVVADQEAFVEARFTDTEPPSIALRSVNEAKVGEAISVEAQIQDNLGVDGVSLFYRSESTGAFRETDMAKAGGDVYRGIIPSEAVKTLGVYYYIQAFDGTNRAFAPGDSSSPGFIQAIEPVGDLIVDSDPPGADVTVDEEPKGRTPITLNGIKAGIRVVTLNLDGYRLWRGEVRIEDGGRVRSSVTLEPLLGSMAVSSSPSGAKVYLDGEPKGQTPIEISQVSVGNHQLRLSLRGYRDWMDQVAVEPGGRVSRQVALALMAGWVWVASEPAGATATIDGRLIGQTPLERIELPAGEHRLNLVKDRFASADATFTVADNDETRLAYTLDQTSFMVDINSQPTAARLYIDGTLRGATPLKALDLPVGEHKIKLFKNRYAPYEGKLTLKAGKEPMPFSFDLAPLFGTLKVVTTPPGASVYLQDRLIGLTPLELSDAPVGRHDLRIERGKYKPVAAQVAVRGDDTTSVDLVLEPKPGYLEVRSVPDGARVSVGDRYIGDTPVGRIELKPGEYTIKITKPRFKDASVPARIESDEITSISLNNLLPLPGYLSVISSPEGAEVKLDGGVLGITPLTRIELKAGTYRLSLVKADYRSAETTASVESVETATAHLTLQYLFGSLRVSSEPAGARVDLDGSSVGSTPLTLARVGIGAHRIRLSLEDYQDYEGKVVIESNRPSEFTASFKIKPGTISLTSDPSDALVYLNGRYMGNSPISLAGLEPSAYDLALTHTGYEVWEKKGITVSPGATTNVRAQLDKHILYQEVRTLGKEGPEAGRLRVPLAVVRDIDGSLYVADAGRHSVVKYSEDGRFLFKIGGDGSSAGSGSTDGQFNMPRGLALDKDGNLYVSDSLNNRIQKFDRDGSFLMKFGGGGSGPGEFRKPAGIAIDPQGDLWVVDSENHRLQEFSADGNYLFSLGGSGSGRGQFNNPEGVAIDVNGNIYAVDWGNSRVQRFSPDGKLLSSFGGPGRGKGQFIFPSSATIDKAGDLYVTDTGNNRIHRFDSDGNFLMYVQPAGKSIESFSGPHGVSAAGDGIVTVVERDAAQVRLLKPVWDQEYDPKI
jgi:sugar lactone lactonase YvrE